MVQRMEGILEEFRKLVEEQAKTDNYDYVLGESRLSTSQAPFLLYTKDATPLFPFPDRSPVNSPR